MQRTSMAKFMVCSFGLAQKKTVEDLRFYRLTFYLFSLNLDDLLLPNDFNFYRSTVIFLNTCPLSVCTLRV